MKNKFNIYKQGSWSIISRILTSIISFIAISILLQILGPNQYGIWITISGFFASLSFVDLGLANGLRNALPKFEDDRVKSNNLIIQTFVLTIIIALIFSILFEVFSISNFFIDYLKLKEEIVGLENIVSILFYLFIITLCVKPAHAVIQAEHKSHLVSFLILFIQFLCLLCYFILEKLKVENSLYIIVLIFSITSVLIQLIFCFYVLFSRVKNLSNISFNILEATDLIKSGFLFFITAFTYLIIFQILNIIIIRNLGSSSVSEFNIYSKLFFAVNQIAVAGLLPIWSAFASANENNDSIWKKNIFLKIEKSFLIVMGVLFITFISGKLIFLIWLGNEGFTYSYILGALFSVLSILIVVNTTYSYILNGLSKLKLQLILNCMFIILLFSTNYFNMISSFTNLLIILIFSFTCSNFLLRKKIKINL